MRLWHRVTIALLLAGLLFGLGSYAEASEEARNQYPTPAELDTDYDRYVGQETLVFGTVERIDGSEARILVTDDEVEFPLRVRGFDTPVDVGGVVQVHGTLRPDWTIDARGMTVVNPGAGADLAKYVISGIAALVFLAVFFRDWRPDFASLTIRKRTRDEPAEGHTDG